MFGNHSTARARAELRVRTGPGDAGSSARAREVPTLSTRAGRRRVDRPGPLRVASQDLTILMSAYAPQPGQGPISATGGDVVPRFG